MTPFRGNRFEDFFADDAYVSLKNLLYNYLLRKRTIRKCMQKQEKGLDPGGRKRPVADGDRFR